MAVFGLGKNILFKSVHSLLSFCHRSDPRVPLEFFAGHLELASFLFPKALLGFLAGHLVEKTPNHHYDCGCAFLHFHCVGGGSPWILCGGLEMTNLCHGNLEVQKQITHMINGS